VLSKSTVSAPIVVGSELAHAATRAGRCARHQRRRARVTILTKTSRGVVRIFWAVGTVILCVVLLDVQWRGVDVVFARGAGFAFRARGARRVILIKAGIAGLARAGLALISRLGAGDCACRLRNRHEEGEEEDDDEAARGKLHLLWYQRRDQRTSLVVLRSGSRGRWGEEGDGIERKP
jgi:hypothetical protein